MADRLSFIDFLSASIDEVPLGYTMEFIGVTQHQGAWSDIVAKAKRLILSGNVTILRNAPNHVMAHVVGDHGEYNSEISRHDPSSQIIEQWTCECPWDQYAFDRTRKWKYLEGRVCSHVLAAYWKAKSTPLDITGEEPGYAAPGGQATSPAGPGQLGLPGLGPAGSPSVPAPTGTEEVGDTGMATAPTGDQPSPPSQQAITVPPQPASPFNQNPKRPNKPQRDQLQLFDITAPPGMQPVPPMLPVSVPGGRPATPSNPVQFPGTFSHFLPIFTIEADFHYAQDEFEQWLTAERSQGRTPIGQLVRPVALEQSGGKIPMPGAEPANYTPEGIAQYPVLQLGYDPATNARVPASTPPAGAPEQQGVYSDAPAGKKVEILDFEPSMRMVYVNVPLQFSGPLHPHSLRGWVNYDDIRPLPGALTPARKPRR